jgi:hypothetical protein
LNIAFPFLFGVNRSINNFIVPIISVKNTRIVEATPTENIDPYFLQ